MRRRNRTTLLLANGFALLCGLSTAAAFADEPATASEPTTADLEFFEKQIRPLLSAHCLKCHGPEDTKGNLRLDSQQGWITGGDTGPALAPGKPEESLLVAAIRYEDEYLEMPPDGKLPEAKIKLLEEWVRRGAPGPKVVAVETSRAQRGLSIEEGRRFWAYRPLPAVTDSSVSESGLSEVIDKHVTTILNAAGLTANPAAEREVLVRRLYFDLHGLPPTVEQIEEFVKDNGADAYEQLVDRLLASPHFGERWGRHWLDVARFGESLTLRGFVLPEAWRYRDYVIATFNEDRPFDQFIHEQVAGDLLPAESLEQKQRQIIATTFLTLGNTNLEEQDKKQLDMDVVDEQLDTLGKAILGQTIGCARCHDHKFDPIPTRDYYALAGILRNTQMLDHENVSKWKQVPLPQMPDEEERFRQLAAEVDSLKQQSDDLKKRITALDSGGSLEDFRSPKVLPVEDLPGIVVDDSQAKKIGEWQSSQISKRYVGSSYSHDKLEKKGDKTLTFAPELPRNGRYEVRFAYTAGSNRATNVPVTVFGADGEKTVVVDQREAPGLDGFFISLGEYNFEKDGQSFVLVATEGTDGYVIADAVQFIPVEELKREHDKQPAVDASRELEVRRAELKQCEERLKQLRDINATRPQAMSVVERQKITDCPIHIRGSVHTLGDVAPRGFLQIVPAGTSGELPGSESGRRELAAWLTSRENPLPARVYVNRVWHWLFGAGLVRTTDNFGTTGELPSHPELLDSLAIHFVKSGWSVKQLVRSIVLSQSYCRASTESAEGLARDPENRLLWRMNRKRLEAECLRDAMLLSSGEIDFSLGGSPIKPGLTSDYGYREASNRRSVYVPVLRNALPEIFEAFDFADPSLVVGNRNVSTVAPQALFLLNSSFVRDRSTAAARRLLAEPVDDRERMILAFRRLLGRKPSIAELELAASYLSSSDQKPEIAWARLVQSLFASLDFRYRD